MSISTHDAYVSPLTASQPISLHLTQSPSHIPAANMTYSSTQIGSPLTTQVTSDPWWSAAASSSSSGPRTTGQMTHGYGDSVQGPDVPAQPVFPLSVYPTDYRNMGRQTAPYNPMANVASRSEEGIAGQGSVGLEDFGPDPSIRNSTEPGVNGWWAL